MSEQYFAKNPSVDSAPDYFDLDWDGHQFQFETDRGVFSKNRFDYGSQVLLKAVMPEIHGETLDLGCGYGPVGIILAKLTDAKLSMSDINERAVNLAKKNARHNRVDVDIRQSDGFANITEVFDAIVLNPPIRAGKALIYELFAASCEHLHPNGCLYVVIQKKQGADSAKKELSRHFATVDTISRSAGYHVFRAKK